MLSRSKGSECSSPPDPVPAVEELVPSELSWDDGTSELLSCEEKSLIFQWNLILSPATDREIDIL